MMRPCGRGVPRARGADPHDAYTIQKRMLPIAKRLLTFSKFAQRETKPQKEGLEIRHRRYERFPIVDTPIAEGKLSYAP